MVVVAVKPTSEGMPEVVCLLTLQTLPHRPDLLLRLFFSSHSLATFESPPHSTHSPLDPSLSTTLLLTPLLDHRTGSMATSTSATGMLPLAPPVPSLWVLPNPTAVTDTNGPVPETETDNATPSPAEDLATNTASVFPVVHQPFRTPTLLAPPSFASRANQDTVDKVSKPAFLFSTPPPPDPLSCGKPSGQLSPFGVYNDSPTIGSVPPSQSGSGSVLFRKSFAPPTSIVASNGVTSQASKAGETSGVASKSSPFNFFTRTSSPRSSTNIQSTLQPSPLGSISSSGPNTFLSDRFRTPRFANVQFDRNCPTVTSDGTKKDKVKTEEMEDDALVSAHRPDLMAVIPPTVKKRLLQSEIVHLQGVQKRIDAAKDADSKGLFAEIPASVTLTKNEFREIRNIQSKIIQSTICNDELELPSAKRQKVNDDGMGKGTILNEVPCYPGASFSIPSNAMAKGKEAVDRPSGVNGLLDMLPVSICDVAVSIWADFI
jgi:hypothetical protein